MLRKALCALAVPVFLWVPEAAVAHFSHVRNGCQNVDYSELGKSVVGLIFTFDKPDADGNTGRAGTAWFVTPTLLATVSHVARGMFVDTDWREVELGWGEEVREPLEERFPFMVRYYSTFTTGLVDDEGLPEDVVLLEIQAPIAGRVPAGMRFKAVEKDEPVVAIGYRGAKQDLQWAAGHYSPPEPTEGEPDPNAERLQPFLYFEMTNEEGKDRHVLDHGTSGSPVFDCSGKVVAIVNGIRTTEFGSFPSFTTDGNGMVTIDGSKSLRVTPPIGQANNTAVPSSVITGIE